MSDILTACTKDPIWSLSNHLETKDGLPVYTILGIGEYWDIKNKQGTQWDRFTFDDKNIYQSITENDQNPAPTAFKMNTANNLIGIGWGPRQYVPGAHNPIISDSEYRRYSACGKFIQQDLGGPSVSWFEGPYEKDFGGDLGVLQALRQVYLWGAGWPNMEVNWYASQTFGRIQWEKWMAGASSPAQVSAYNLVKAGGTPMLQFPCGVPKL